MNVEDYIKKQIIEHSRYKDSFSRAPSISNEQFCEGTNKIISYNESYFLIEKDLEKRVKNIIKKLER